MYDHTLHCGRKHFCRYCLQGFSTEKTLKCLVGDCFKINGQQVVKMPRMLNMLEPKTMKEKLKQNL